MYGYPEFPTTNFHDYDLRELIHMYKKLVDEYDGLVADIGTLKSDFGNYQSYVNNSIAPLVHNANMQYLTKLTLLENQVKAANTQFNNSLASEIANRKSADQNLCNMISNLQNQLFKWQEEYKSTLAQIQQITDGKIEANKLFLMGRDAYFNDKMLDVTADLQHQINSLPKQSETVVNPVTEKTDNVNNAIRDIWDYAVPWGGLTCEEFDKATYITCEYWDKSGVTCLDWYTQGKIKLHWYYPVNHVFSPVTGEYVTLQTAIYQLAEKLGNGITAGEYDEKAVTAEVYDEMEITANNYDWKGKEILENV